MVAGVCSIEGCGRPVLARGWCKSHYDRWKRHGDPEVGGPIQPRRVRGARVSLAPPAGREPEVPVLRCATPAEYWLWAGKRGEPPAEIINPLTTFCRDAERPWCEEQRAAGLCCRSRVEYRLIKGVTRATDEDDDTDEDAEEVTVHEVPRTIDWTVWLGGVGSGEPVATVTREGALRVNAAADRLLGEPEAVQVLVAQGGRLIGIRAALPDAEGAIQMRRKEGSAFVRCKAFFLFHRIPLDATRRFRVQLVDGVLVLDRSAEPLPIPGQAA